METATPTPETYAELEAAYGYFNNELFGGGLPACLITLQRERKTYGYFSGERFVRRGDGLVTDEIALNPTYFAVRSIEDILSTLVHEQVHLWQAHFGKPGRGRYHNKEWAKRMEAVGLIASHTGEPGGRQTGDRMTHYVKPGGLFEQACRKLLTDRFTLSWLDRFPPCAPGGGEGEDLEGLGIEAPDPKKKAKRIKYTCPSCGTNVWGKPSLRLRCAECDPGPLFEEVEG